MHTYIHNLFFFKMILFLENKNITFKHTYFQNKRNLILLQNSCKCIQSALREKLTFAAAVIFSSKLPPSQKSYKKKSLNMNQEIHLYYTCIIIYVLNSPLFHSFLLRQKSHFPSILITKKEKERERERKHVVASFQFSFPTSF